MNSFFKGTFLLIVAAFVGECVEFVTNMVLARELGEKGLGMYMAVLPTVFLIVLLASFEMPISISKFIAEKDKRIHRSMLKHVLKWTIILTCILMVVVSIILPFVPVFDQYHPIFRWLVLILIPIVSFTSIARGYFMGRSQMGKIAFSNFLRKIVQLLLLVYLFQLFDFEIKMAVLIAFCTLIGSDLIVFLYLFHVFMIQYQYMKNQPSKRLHGKVVMKNLMEVSLPTTALRVFHAVTSAVEPFLITGALYYAGVSKELATEQFGMVAGIAMVIGSFPTFIAHSFMIMLIPTISKANADRNKDKLQKLLKRVMLLTFAYGIPAVAICYFLAEPLTSTFFHSPGAARYLQLLWPCFLFRFFIMPLQAYLIGLGMMKEAFIHGVWATITAFAIIYFLGSKSSFQMDGVIIGINAEAVLLMLMHYVTVCKKIGVSIFMTPLNQVKHS
ncbi:oligosaccharide flippase family protein [Bacillus sp. V3B]|uniref:oligosaccharide flippase family protein n=1 Tax=Bacillus sp. V3B TaxID=2804915 RepID=UPI00210F1476|nr:oligosaccharide flippase family protein [Bacillus sp. V3B]MCQ6275190.1 oligosaccharide flippase family protein [Bacillus sp. V3B]